MHNLLVSIISLFALTSLISLAILISHNQFLQPSEKNFVENNKFFTQAPSASPLMSPPPISLVSVSALPKSNKIDTKNYELAISLGAQFIANPDTKNYVILWRPENWEQNKKRKIILSIHGRNMYAIHDFVKWYPYLKDQTIALASFEWNEKQSTEDLYAQIISFIRKEQITQSDQIILHGFSRGSVNTYGLKLLDIQTNNFFSYVFSNAGGILSDIAINKEILNGKYGEKPFEGVHWILYCGEKDSDPNLYGCPQIIKTKKNLEEWGAIVDLFIDDPNGGHTGFFEDQENVNQLLQVINK